MDYQEKEIAALIEHLKTHYQGSFDKMTKHLYELMGMLHFLDTEVFSQEQIKEKAYILFRLLECLNESNKQSEPLVSCSP